MRVVRLLLSRFLARTSAALLSLSYHVRPELPAGPIDHYLAGVSWCARCGDDGMSAIEIEQGHPVPMFLQCSKCRRYTARFRGPLGRGSTPEQAAARAEVG